MFHKKVKSWNLVTVFLLHSSYRIIATHEKKRYKLIHCGDALCKKYIFIRKIIARGVQLNNGVHPQAYILGFVKRMARTPPPLPLPLPQV